MNIYKTKTIEDTELIYSILREENPNNQIDVEYNYNTHEYTITLTETLFTGDPTVPLNITMKVIYGDSVTKDTPLLLRNPVTNNIMYKTIEEICNSSTFVEYPEFKIFDTVIPLEKSFSTTDYEVWSDLGWNPIQKVIKHRTNKKIYRILTNNGCVDVTEDHSLYTSVLEKIKPNQVKVGQSLLYYDLPKCTINPDYYNNYTKHIGFLNQTKSKAAELYHHFYHEWDGNIKICIEPNSPIYKYNVLKTDYTSSNTIISISELPECNDFVYDLETQFGRFNAGIGQIIVSNTDSIFISIKFNRNNFEENRKDAFKLALQCGDNITDMFGRPPIHLEFEKVYQPFVLLTKKRYIGKKYEDTRDPMKLKVLTTSGIAITRRDYCDMVKKCYKEVINIIMDTSNLEESIEIFKRCIDRIDNYQIDFDDLQVSAMLAKNYSCSTCKEKTEWNKLICSKHKCNFNNVTERLQNCPKCKTPFKCLHKFSLAHVNLGLKLLSRNEDISINDRIQYLFIESNITNKKAELAEDPKYAKDNSLKYNRSCYLEQLAKPLLAFFKVVLQNEEELMDDLIECVNNKLTEYGGSKLKPSDYKLETEID